MWLYLEITSLERYLRLNEVVRVDPNLTAVLIKRENWDTQRHQRKSKYKGQTAWGHSKKVRICRSRREASGETTPANTWILFFQPPEREIITFCRSSCPACDSSLWQPEQTETALNHIVCMNCLAWPKASAIQRYTKTLLSGRVFQRLRSYAPGAGKGSPKQLGKCRIFTTRAYRANPLLHTDGTNHHEFHGLRQQKFIIF